MTNGPPAVPPMPARGPAGAGKPTPALAARSITKRFPGVVANDQVTFEVLPGEIHALLGENGAGKTTLCNILTALYRADEGYVEVHGEPASFRSPRDSHEAGIFMVHQHYRLVQPLSVAENMVLGWSRQRGMWFAPRRVEREVAELAEQFHVPIDPRAKIWQLSVGEQQRVEILKALYRSARILILDEPTTVLAPQEVEQLFETLRGMAAGGASVVFISHKLPEVLAVADRITVLRAGKAIGTVARADTDARSLARMMVGRDIVLTRIRSTGAKAGEVVLGLSGVIAGERPRTAGTISIAGQPQPGTAWEAIDAGLGYVPEERMGVGVAPGLTIADNLMLKSYREDGQGPILHAKQASLNAAKLIERFDIVARGPKTLARELSGGNIQRLLLARELSGHPKILIAASPTRGLDVAATESVRRLLVQSAERGVGVLLVSEDLDEVLDLSDRVAVMYRGRVVGVVDRDNADVDRIGLLMSGVAS